VQAAKNLAMDSRTPAAGRGRLRGRASSGRLAPIVAVRWFVAVLLCGYGYGRRLASTLESYTEHMATSLLARMHNPHGHVCACLPSCWCKRTVWGTAVRWYVPVRFHRLPPHP
jgi:hypothetical protein